MTFDCMNCSHIYHYLLCYMHLLMYCQCSHCISSHHSLIFHQCCRMIRPCLPHNIHRMYRFLHCCSVSLQTSHSLSFHNMHWLHLHHYHSFYNRIHCPDHYMHYMSRCLNNILSLCQNLLYISSQFVFLYNLLAYSFHLLHYNNLSIDMFQAYKQSTFFHTTQLAY